MGAQFNTVGVPKEIGDQGSAVMQAWGYQIIEQALYDHGHAGYSGSFAEANGVSVCQDMPPFDNEDLAAEWLDCNAEKWGPLMIVPYRDGANVLWIGGCWCSS